MSFSFVWLLAGIVLGAIIGHLLVRYTLATGKKSRKKKREKDDRPAWERMADAYEKAAERLLADAVNSAEAGYPGSSRRSLEEADEFMAEANRIRQQALEDMMEGKIL